MSNPPQPEPARKTPAQDPHAVAGVLDGQREPGADAPRGPVPPDNQPGHHPDQEQDKPDMKAFAEKLGTVEPSEREGEPATAGGGAEAPAGEGGRRRAVAIVAAAASLAAVLLAVVAGRRRRSRRRR